MTSMKKKERDIIKREHAGNRKEPLEHNNTIVKIKHPVKIGRSQSLESLKISPRKKNNKLMKDDGS